MTLFQVVVSSFLMPLTLNAAVLMYIDLRVRKEAYDVASLTQDLG